MSETTMTDEQLNQLLSETVALDMLKYKYIYFLSVSDYRYSRTAYNVKNNYVNQLGYISHLVIERDGTIKKCRHQLEGKITEEQLKKCLNAPRHKLSDYYEEN